jgi:hypothetical protein
MEEVQNINTTRHLEEVNYSPMEDFERFRTSVEELTMMW